MNTLSTVEFGTITRNDAHTLICVCGNSDATGRGFMANNELGTPFFFGVKKAPEGLAELNFDSTVLYSCLECGRTYNEMDIFENVTAPVVATRDIQSEEFINKIVLYQRGLQIN